MRLRDQNKNELARPKQKQRHYLSRWEKSTLWKWNSWMKECAPYITHAPKDGGGVCHNNAYLGITNNYNMFGPILDSPIIFRKDKGSLSH